MGYQNSLLTPSTLLPVMDDSSPGEIRRFVRQAAEQLHFDDERAGKASIVATELAGNICRHAKDGVVIVRVHAEGETGVLDLLALDRGPGMRDVERCMEDGYSTQSGGSGTGLGAIRRLSDHFDIQSVPGIGSAVLARFGEAPAPLHGMDVGALSLPFPGEIACGDAWSLLQTPDCCVIAVVDGLGHGVDAALAAAEALKVLADAPRRTVEQTLQFAHGALKATRGAAIAVAEIRSGLRRIRYAGVGNIVGAMASPEAQRRMVSFEGTIGHELHQVRSFDYPLDAGQIVILHSDGLRSQWALERYPGLLRHDPFLIAGVLYRDYLKGHDDVTVVVGREMVH